MKRLAVTFSVGGLLIGLALILSPRVASRFVPSVPSLSEAATPPESVELPELVATPGVITIGVPTLLTVSPVLPADVKGPQLQFLDPATSKWQTLLKLKDNGKGPDQHAKDGEFSGRLRFDESSGVVSVSLPTRKGSRLLTQIPAPVRLRVAGRKQGQRGLVVSPSLNLPVAPPTPATLNPGTGAPSITVMVPPTVDILRHNGSPKLSMTREAVRKPSIALIY